MYKTSNGIEVYETVKDLVDKGVTHIWDYQENYYVLVKSDDFYESRIWVVNKKTNQVSKGYYIDFMIEIQDKATPIDPETLRRALK